MRYVMAQKSDEVRIETDKPDQTIRVIVIKLDYVK